MAKVTQAAKVGAFVVVAGAATLFVYRSVDKTLGSGSGYTVYTILDDASGLANHSRVTIAGIPVGTIDGIRLDHGKARVDIRVDKGVLLYQNATVGKKSASLLGESLLVVTPGTTEPPLKDGDEIHTLPPEPSIDDIKNNVAEIASLVKEVARQLAASVGTEEGGKNMRAILKNLAEATDALNGTIRENRELVHETLSSVNSITKNGQPEVAKILENVRVITEDVRRLTSQGEGGGQGGEIKETIANINRASKSLESALAHIDNVSGRLDRGEGTLGKLSKDDALVNEVQGVAEGVNDFVGGITRLQTIVGLRNDYNFLANTIKSYVELRLQPREDKYYVIELINDPRGKTNFSQSDVSTTNPNEPSNYRVITTTTTDAFRFSLQFARRLGPFTGRFGIKESTGGLGLDIHLLQDRFELRSDLFGFGEEIQPRFRVYIGYEFINRLWLLGGVDHLFLAGRRDYFLGLELRFNDEDLKSVLTVGGGAAGAGR
jgi:phospholipid/cholesterol/gamma-HCH transport system substrate-binding protein